MDISLNLRPFPDFKLRRIEILSNYPTPNIDIFSWEFKLVNFLFGVNNAGKTTLFHILKDIMGNPNVGGAGVKGGSILTQDLALRDIEVTLYFSIGDREFKTIKGYGSSSKQRFWQSNPDLYIGARDTFIEFLEKEEIMSIPHIKYKDKEKLTLFSIMRLCFIEQDGGFGNKSKISGHKFSSTLIKHTNDGRTKILFYAYILGIILNEDYLGALYEELGKLSEIENELEGISKNIKIITGSRSIEEEGGMFDIFTLVKEIQKLRDKKRTIDISNFNYEKILNKFERLLKYNNTKEEINSNMNIYVHMLKTDMESILLKIKSNKEEILTIDNEIKEIEKKIKIGESLILDEFLHEMKSLSVETGDRDIFQALKIRAQELNNTKSDLMKTFSEIKEKVIGTDKYKNFVNFIYEANKNYFSHETVNIVLDEGRYYFTTTADSLNRIALFNILTSFLFLKKNGNIQHPNFIIFDSPFVGVNKTNEVSAINNFLTLYENSESNGQFFIFLNPEDFDDELNINIHSKEYISIYDATNKVFNI